MLILLLQNKQKFKINRKSQSQIFLLVHGKISDLHDRGNYFDDLFWYDKLP